MVAHVGITRYISRARQRNRKQSSPRRNQCIPSDMLLPAQYTRRSLMPHHPKLFQPTSLLLPPASIASTSW